MRRGLLVLVLLGAALLGMPAPGHSSASPTMRVLGGAWFDLTVKSTYAMHWSVDASASCGYGDTEFLDAQASETMSFGTRRPVRLFAFDVLAPGIRKGPRIPILFFSSHSWAVGMRVYPEELVKTMIRTPAVWSRSLSGGYQNCGSAPQTLSPNGCGAFRTPRFTTALNDIEDTRAYRGWILLDSEEIPNSSLPSTNCQPDDPLPSLGQTYGFLQDGPPLWRVTCPSPAAIVARRRSSCTIDRRNSPVPKLVNETFVLRLSRERRAG